MLLDETRLKLEKYEAFEPEIIEQVVDAADWQHKHRFSELADYYGVPDGPQLAEPYPGAKHPIEVLEFDPVGYEPENEAVRVLFAPFGNAVTKNIAMRAMRLFQADDSQRLLVIGNPALPGRRAKSWPVQGAGKVDLAGRQQMAQGDLLPRAEPVLQYLNSQQVEEVALFTGYSWGADLAASATLHSEEYGITTNSSVLLEPGGTSERSVFGLAKAFVKSGEHLERYINSVDSAAYKTAVYQTAGNSALFGAGLLRPTNIASARALARGKFLETVNAIADKNSINSVTVGWCGKSEIVNGQELAENLNPKIGRIVLERAHHAVGDDIDVHAAAVLQGHNNNIQSSLIARILALRSAINSDHPA